MKKLLISFSGGETSAYMTQWLLKHKRAEYEMIIVFANTGEENEETLEFVQKCELLFNYPIVWVEAVVHHGQRKGTSHRIVNFETATRRIKHSQEFLWLSHFDTHPFIEVIKKYGIPNVSTPHCTRELKERPINSYAKSIGWKNYYTAIGIRIDEVDRVNAKHETKRLIYPLVSKDMQPMTKPKINFWWSQQDFRLNLTGYQGNCITCWKKGDKKLWTIAKESPESFLFNTMMEKMFKMFVPITRLIKMKSRGETPTLPVYFFRGNRSSETVIEQSEIFFGSVVDDSKIMPEILEEDESCEVFTQCGNHR